MQVHFIEKIFIHYVKQYGFISLGYGKYSNAFTHFFIHLFYVPQVFCFHAHQNAESSSVIGGCELPWENCTQDRWKSTQVLLAMEPSLQPLGIFLNT